MRLHLLLRHRHGSHHLELRRLHHCAMPIICIMGIAASPEPIIVIMSIMDGASGQALSAFCGSRRCCSGDLSVAAGAPAALSAG